MVAWNASWMTLGLMLALSLLVSGCLQICTEDGSCGGTHVSGDDSDEGGDEYRGPRSIINGVECRSSTSTSQVLEWSVDGDWDTATSPAFTMPVNTTRAQFQLKESGDGASAGSWRATLEREGGDAVATLEFTGSTGPVTAMMNARTQAQITAPPAGDYVVDWTGPAITQGLTFMVTATACP